MKKVKDMEVQIILACKYQSPHPKQGLKGH